MSATGANDRGLKRARFYVIRKVSCPAVLVEVGFLSNRAEELKLGKNEYQDKIAEAIADGIYNYHRAMIIKR
ncbi:MAG: N-acetylmuramoyl-L-alanine amidase [Victivallales bacterium]|nr:N-acetylmuramoyl-L-alanine amidase [Victivallales bacterium]